MQLREDRGIYDRRRVLIIKTGGEGVERGSEGSEREVEDAMSDVGENQDV